MTTEKTDRERVEEERGALERKRSMELEREFESQTGKDPYSRDGSLIFATYLIQELVSRELALIQKQKELEEERSKNFKLQGIAASRSDRIECLESENQDLAKDSACLTSELNKLKEKMCVVCDALHSANTNGRLPAGLGYGVGIGVAEEFLSSLTQPPENKQ